MEYSLNSLLQQIVIQKSNKKRNAHECFSFCKIDGIWSSMVHEFIEVAREKKHFEGIILYERVHVLCSTNGKQVKMLQSVVSMISAGYKGGGSTT